MEISQFKQKFTDYLENLYENFRNEESSGKIDESSTDAGKKQYDLDNPNISVFSNAQELDDFLNKNYKDEMANVTVKTEDILKLEFKDGQFVEKEKSDENKIPIVGIINDLLLDEKIKQHIDENGDKKITEEEAKRFINTIKTLDGKESDISVKDVIDGIKKIDKLNIGARKAE